MKRVYATPKAKRIDFSYDVQVTAVSAGDIGLIGDPGSLGLCQQVSDTLCRAFWSSEFPEATCREEPRPWSLRDLV